MRSLGCRDRHRAVETSSWKLAAATSVRCSDSRQSSVLQWPQAQNHPSAPSTVISIPCQAASRQPKVALMRHDLGCHLQPSFYAEEVAGPPCCLCYHPPRLYPYSHSANPHFHAAVNPFLRHVGWPALEPRRHGHHQQMRNLANTLRFFFAPMVLGAPPMSPVLAVLPRLHYCTRECWTRPSHHHSYSARSYIVCDYFDSCCNRRGRNGPRGSIENHNHFGTHHCGAELHLDLAECSMHHPYVLPGCSPCHYLCPHPAKRIRRLMSSNLHAWTRRHLGSVAVAGDGCHPSFGLPLHSCLHLHYRRSERQTQQPG